MKTFRFVLFAIAFHLLLIPFVVSQTCCNEDIDMDSFLPYSTNPDFKSQFGYFLPANGIIRILIAFVEVEYTTPGIDPRPNGTTNWPAHSLPTWADDLLEPNIPSGLSSKKITNYFQLASSNNFIVLGDYLVAPDNGGIFKVVSNAADINQVTPSCQTSLINQATNQINQKLGTSIVTAHGINSVNDYDLWTITGLFEQKITPSIDNPPYIDHVMFIWRNTKWNNTGVSCLYTINNFLGNKVASYCSFGTYEHIPTEIMRHEFGHQIFGGNLFHCAGGGNQTNYWIPMTGGWSAMGLANSSLLCWNAWDRQRLNWKGTGNIHTISARDIIGNEVNGDLDPNNPNDAGVYILRDFVTSGDAIRIKLPFTSAENEFNQYIWLENHQTTALNNCEFDQYKFHETLSCRDAAVPGLYSYLQINRDVNASDNRYEVNYGFSDYLRPLTAEGFFDREYQPNAIQNNCVNDEYYNPFVILNENSNPLTGGGDMDFYPYDINQNQQIEHQEEYINYIEFANSTYYKKLYLHGHPRQAFTLNGNKKIGIGTNPGSATLINLVSLGTTSHTYTPYKNIRKNYLNGISVEIMDELPDGSIKVRIRFDDVEIANNIRWCSPEIVLNEIATPSGYSLILKEGVNLLLDQGMTATQMINPITYNQKEVFTSQTIMKCKENSSVLCKEESSLKIQNGSTLILEGGCQFNLDDLAYIEVMPGCTLSIEACAALNIKNDGLLIAHEGAVLCLSPQAIINLEKGYNNLQISPGVIIPTGYYHPNQFVVPSFSINSTENWNGLNLNFSDNLTIEAGGILTIQNSTLSFAANNKILIKRGGQLIVDNSTLTSFKYCSEFGMWRGIEVWGNSELSQIPQSNQGWVRVVNGGKIENAICAIKTFRPTEEDNGTPMQNYTGGIVQADGAIFKNNRTAVHFLGYNQSNISSFQECTFETTESLKDNSVPDYFIKLEGVTSIPFYGCSFENKITPGSIQVEDRGSGIYAINSDIILLPLCTQTINPCPEIDYKRNLFKNLYRGIYGLSTGPDKMVSIDRTDFETNYRGLYLSAMNYATLTRNYIHVWEEQFTQNPQTYGFYLDQCTGYHIESNNFNSENPAQRGIGLIIHKSGQANNTVYNNTFSNLRIATQAQDENRGREYDGLCYKCNDFSNNMYDIRATVSQTPINIYSGIAARQGANVTGDNRAPAGNTFTQDAQATYNLSNYANAFTYFRHQYTSGPKIHPNPNTGSGGITVSLVPQTTYSKTIACPSTLTYGEIEDEKDAMDMAGGSESDTRLLLQELVDGGNTEILDAQIQSSSTANAADLYQELMATAPYLSDVALGSSITKEEVLVDAMIRDILVANPQSAKSDELLDQLEQRANPLPEYMWDEIMQGASVTGAKENLESELVHWMQEKYRHRNNALRLYLSDLGSTAAMNGLLAFLLEESTFESLRQLAMLKASANDFTGARAIITQMGVAFENDPEQISEIDGLSGLVDVLESLSVNFNGSYQSGSNNIPALQGLYSASSGLSGVLSRNYLVHGNELAYDEPIHGEETLKAGNKLRGKNGAGISAANALLAIFPNPAHDYFMAETSTDDAGLSLQMVTSLGQTIKTQTVITRKSVVITKGLKPGLYFVQLVKQDKVLASEKIVIK